MRVGYSTTIDDVPRLEEAGVDYIVLTEDKNFPLQAFKTFLEENKPHDIFLVGIHSMGLDISLIQLYDTFTYLIQENYMLTFLDKGVDLDLTNRDYLLLVWHLMKNEKKAAQRRTRKGIAKARERGNVAGRPSVKQEVIDQICALHTKEKRTIREIAGEVGLSIGTVHKYLPKSEGH